MTRETGNIHDEPRFDALRLQGVDRREAVTVANSPKAPGSQAPNYEEWSLEELRRRAEQLDIRDAWTLSREEAIRRLRAL